MTRTGIHAFDRYSLAHAAMGSLFGLVGVPAVWAIGSHVVFEVLEDKLKDRPAAKKIFPETRHDSLANHAGDVLSFAGGFAVGRAGLKAPMYRPLAAGITAVGGLIWGYNARRALKAGT